jgi:outer membrane protein TolC
MQDKKRKIISLDQGKGSFWINFGFFFVVLFFISVSFAYSSELNLDKLIDTALKNNPEILAAESRLNAVRFKIPQSQSLPDPMLMIGYQNEGTRDLYSFGRENAPDAQWMFSLSQMFPFPGKLSLKGQMALWDAESQKWFVDSVRLKVISKIKELYYDLFLTYKTIDILKKQEELFLKIEDAALSRYSTGLASQQEVLMAQTEKYMLIEREQMLRQRIQSLEAMINSILGREINTPLGRPENVPVEGGLPDLDRLILMVFENSPEIKAKEKMVSSAEKRLEMARLEYYPDFTISASYFLRSKFFPDMWSLSTSINIPIFYKTKQRELVNEASAFLSEAKYELESARLMLSSIIRDNYSMMETSERLMMLYKEGLIPKTDQKFESSLSDYISGKGDLNSLLSTLKTLLNYEISYWGQFAEKQKARARIEAIIDLRRN